MVSNPGVIDEQNIDTDKKSFDSILVKKGDGEER